MKPTDYVRIRTLSDIEYKGQLRGFDTNSLKIRILGETSKIRIDWTDIKKINIMTVSKIDWDTRASAALLDNYHHDNGIDDVMQIAEDHVIEQGRTEVTLEDLKAVAYLGPKWGDPRTG